MAPRKILIVGSGGREHALVVSIAQSLRADDTIFVAPGNAGITRSALGPRIIAAPAGQTLDALVAWAHAEGVDFVVIGPEAPLAEGLADKLTAAGVRCFGPSAACARLESSKAFAKDFMARHGIQTAKYRVFTDFPAAEEHIRSCGYPVVIKASGLAAGKGVFVPRTTDEAVAAARSVLVERIFGAAGDDCVVEELLEGPEASVIGVSDGKTVIALPAAQVSAAAATVGAPIRLRCIWVAGPQAGL